MMVVIADVVVRVDGEEIRFLAIANMPKDYHGGPQIP